MKKKIVANIFYIIICVLFILLPSCEEKETIVEVSSVSLNTATIQMVEGETFNLVATVLPKDAEYDGVIWTSSNALVANVNSGTVTALKEGFATITANAGGKSSTCNVMVSSKVIPVTSVTLDKTSLSMLVGETATLSATVTPDNASDKSVIWGSSDVSIAIVTDGKVTAQKSGTVIITATSGNCKAECVVTVSVSTESVILDKTSLSLMPGETATITATVKPDDATDKTVTWSSSDESVARVDGGKVTAVKDGRTTITAKCGEKTAECSVTVSVPVTSITLDKTSLSLTPDETATVTASVKPDDATDKTVTWSSSDELVARVDGGKVTAVKAGKATLTAKCGGKIAECVVTVAVPVMSISLDQTNITISVGESAQLIATVSPADATDKNVIWSSSDESVVKVDNGKVAAVRVGSATIKAECGGKFAECVVGIISPDRVIIYTTRNGKVISINNENVFGAAIVSNEYVDGVGRIVFDGPVTSIGKAAFLGCTNITSMKLPNTVTRIGVGAFKGCSNLKSINTPSSLSIIDSEAFYFCRSLSFFSLPEGLSKIENNTFYMCEKMVIDRIPSNVTTIGSGAFSFNYALEKLIIPYGVVSVGSNAFLSAGIKELKLPNSLTSIGFRAFSDIKVKTLTIPGSLKIIGKCIFSSAYLSEIILEEGMITIDREAFSDNERLKKVVFPSTIKTLFPGIFDGCISFSDLYIKANTPPVAYSGASNVIMSWTDSVFGGDIDFNIWVPSAAVDAYKNSWYWNRYKDHIKGYDF